MKKLKLIAPIAVSRQLHDRLTKRLAEEVPETNLSRVTREFWEVYLSKDIPIRDLLEYIRREF